MATNRLRAVGLRLPRRVAIMRAYRGRVTVRSAQWTAVGFDVDEAWSERAERLAAS